MSYLRIVSILILVPFLLIVDLAAQGVATVTGKVTDVATGDPLPGANVFINALNVGSAADVDGNYAFSVPATSVRGQEVEVTVQYIGYHTATIVFTLTAGTITQDFQLKQDVLRLEEVVVTGVVGGTPLTKTTFAIDRVTREELEMVPAISAEAAIRGKVAGARVIKGSGRPGTSASVQLRGATSINATGRSQEPLYIVDGVILSEGAAMADIDARDIESIEVVKGAAASSLYGSRAANGVIQIRTSRGKNLPLGKTRITFRSETGYNQLPRKMPMVSYNTYKLAGSNYTDANGNKVEVGDFIDSDENWVDPRDPQGGRDTDWFAPDSLTGIRFQDNPFKYVSTGVPSLDDDGTPNQKNMPDLLPKGGFDQLDRFFDPGQFQTTSISIAQNMPSTNFFASFTNSREPGVLYTLEGNTRNSLRVNLDHNITETAELSVSTYYSQSTIDEVDDLMGSAFFDITFMPPDVDLLKIDETDWEREDLEGNWDPRYDEEFVRPDPTNVEEENPIYMVKYQDRERTRNRFLTNVRMSYRPITWFSLEGNLSLDRTEHVNRIYYPKGYKTVGASSANRGWLSKFHEFNEAFNADVTASFFQSFGALTLRSKLRYLYEKDQSESSSVRGSNMAVGGISSLSAANDKEISSSQSKVLAEGYYFIGGADYAGKYIGDFMIRRDGSSLFGGDEQWHNYYRFSGAYRISEEPFWASFKETVNEFKLRFSQGTAGNRPAFTAQYETYPVSNGSLGGRETLGNRDLKPEFATETEFGVDLAIFDRFSVQLTSAKSVVEDQLLLVPLSGTFGVPAQWQNAGTLETSTLEASVQAVLLQTKDITWSAGFIWDKTTQEITEFSLPAYTWAPENSQDMTTFYVRKGETLGTMYGTRWVTSKDGLPSDVDKSEFQKNDDGYVVWVGTDHDYTDGISDILWGIDSDDGNYKWGMPIAEIDKEGNKFLRIGSAVPDFSYGFTTTFRFRNLSIYALFEGQVGGNIYNMTSQWGMRDNKVAEVDQSGKKEGKKKPTAYYQVLYNVRSPNSHFVEDGTYMKLQELSLRYNFSLKGLNRITVGVIGRNLLTWTDYSGYDPEVGTGGGQGGSAVLTRFDGYQYPNFRSVSFIFEVEL